MLNSLNVCLKIVIFMIMVIVVSSCSSTVPLFKSSTSMQYQAYTIESYNSFLPREYREVVDSTFINQDYIDRKLQLHLPDTLPDSVLYNPDAPVFDPYPNDSGIVLSEKDMALYIKDRELVKAMKSEINARKTVDIAIIKGAVEAEKLYRGTIKESNEYNKQIFDKYADEKANKRTWRNIALFALAFSGGFIVNEYVAHD